MAKMSREEYETLRRQQFAEIRKRIDLQILELEQLQMLTAEEAHTLEELRSDRIILDSNIEEWVILREEVDRRRVTHTVGRSPKNNPSYLLYSINKTLEGLIGKYLEEEEITKYREEQDREQDEEGQGEQPVGGTPEEQGREQDEEGQGEQPVGGTPEEQDREQDEEDQGEQPAGETPAEQGKEQNEDEKENSTFKSEYEQEFDEIIELMEKIFEADEMSIQKQDEINRERASLREETRIVVVDEMKERIAQLVKDKNEFDEMTRAALENARNQVRSLQQKIELEYNAKLVEFLEKQKDIQRKLDSIRARGLDPEKLAMAEAAAAKALEKLKNDMDNYQKQHFERRAKLDEFAKYIENDINVIYSDVKYESPEIDNNDDMPDGDSHDNDDNTAHNNTDGKNNDGSSHDDNTTEGPDNDDSAHDNTEQEDENSKDEEKPEEQQNPQEEIKIPDMPKIRDIDMGDIEEEYTRRKNDMFAKFYGDPEYEKEYKTRLERYKANETAIKRRGVVIYKTIKDYPEREEDEKFLLLDGYREALERTTKHMAGKSSVYYGTPEEIEAQYKRDLKYVETRNSAFDQHEYTRRDLATMGKYGEKVSYLPIKTGGSLAKVGKGVLNVGIFARNLVVPVYRFIGKHVAQLIHRAIYGDKVASPYKNNPFHRMVARRDYFADQARKRDEEATDRKMKEAQVGEQVKPVRHPIRNLASSRFNAIFKAREGNEAVLRAGAYDIQENLKAQNIQRLKIEAYKNHIQDLGRQLTELQAQLDANPNVANADLVKQAIEQRKQLMLQEQEEIDRYDKGGKIVTRQTDAVSDKQHAIASKEVNTLRTTALKSTVKVVTGRFVGPAIKKWLVEHTQTNVTVNHAPVYDKQWQSEVTGTRDIVVDRLDTDSMRDLTVGDLFNSSSDKTVTLAANGVGNSTTRDAFTNIRGFSYTGSNGQVYSMSDGLGFNIAGRTSTSVPVEFLNPDGTINADIPLLEILASLKRGVGENVTAQDLLSEVTSLTSPQEQAQKFQELCNSLNFWQSTRATGMPSGWNDMANEISDFTNGLDVVPVVIGTESYVIEPGKWIDVLKEAGYTEHFTIDNPRVINVLNDLTKTGKVIRRADGTYDIVENLRNTHTNIADNKKHLRQYTYSDESTKTVPTSREDYDDER